MTKTTATLIVAVTILMAACGTVSLVGRSFPSPDPGMITPGKTDKAFLLRVFGEPYQVGLESGNQLWKWFYNEGVTGKSTKELNVTFNPDNQTVKSYSFLSNFPQDMSRMK